MCKCYIYEYFRGQIVQRHGPWDRREAEQHLKLFKMEEEPGVEYILDIPVD